MLLHVRRWLNQKRLCLDLVHEDEQNSMRYFAFHGKVTLARRFRQAHFCEAISQEFTEDAPCHGSSKLRSRNAKPKPP
jgi:hypothetical protein